MHEPSFARFRERLLRAGVAPRHVRRAVAELSDHHASLVAEAQVAGLRAGEVLAAAKARLGDEDTLVAAVVSRPELKSWAHRRPWIVYGICPILALLSTQAVVFFGVVMLTAYTPAGAWNVPGWVKGAGEGYRVFEMFALPGVVAAGTCVFAGQRRARWYWPVASVILVAAVGGFLQFTIEWPEVQGQLGSMTVGVGPTGPDLVLVMARALATAVLTLVPYLWWRARSSRGATLDCA